jgi:ubiquinone/menaquinone biosynthesis C-methylase UbiE
VTSAVQRNRTLFSGPFGALYSAYIERERFSRLIAHVVWGSDVRPYYASMSAIGEMPDGSTIVDCPCGSGVAFRALRPEQRVRYLAFDLSPAMLRRAHARAWVRGLAQPEFVEAAAANLPLAGGEADLFCSYFGLHCFDDPAGALREAARTLRANGRLIGASIVRGDRPLDRLRVRPGVGGFGAVGESADLRQWLDAAGFSRVEIETSGIFAVFSAYARS